MRKALTKDVSKIQNIIGVWKTDISRTYTPTYAKNQTRRQLCNGCAMDTWLRQEQIRTSKKDTDLAVNISGRWKSGSDVHRV